MAMAAANEDVEAIRTRFEEMFDAIAAAIEVAAGKEDHSIASSVAERFGLIETASSAPTGTAWQTMASGFTLWFQWRYYDQSNSFSVHKDMNILSLELRDGDKTCRQAQQRFED
jgi:hypothetical protein